MTAALLGIAGTIITLVTAVVGFVFGRKESDAKAEATSMETAMRLNASLYTRLGAAEATLDKQAKEIDRLARRERIQGRLLVRHERWDAEVSALLKMNDIPLPPLPNLDPDAEPDPDGPRTRAADYEQSRPRGLPPEEGKRSGDVPAS